MKLFRGLGLGLGLLGVPVVFQVIDAPGRPLAGVVLGKGNRAHRAFHLGPRAARIVRAAADIAGVGRFPGRGIDADLQSQGVNLIAHGRHVGELGVGLDAVEFSAPLALPGVVDVDVGPAVVDQPAGGHGPRGVDHVLALDRAVIGVPTVPAHGRGEGDFVADDDAKGLLRLALGIAGAERHLIDAAGGQRAGDLPCGRVKVQAGGEIPDGKNHRPIAAGGDVVQERAAGPDAENGGSVDAGGGGRFGRAQHRLRGGRRGRVVRRCPRQAGGRCQDDRRRTEPAEGFECRVVFHGSFFLG